LIYTLQGKNLTNTPYDRLSEVLTYDNLSQVPTMLKLGPYSQDEVLALGLILPPKSKRTTRSKEVQFDIVVTKATQLIGPHKNPTCGQYTTQGLPSGPKWHGP
jgi:hypothetical protein